MPYLLTDSEVTSLFAAMETFDYPAPWQWQAKAFYGLMATCGLRTCEAQQLDCKDIDYQAKTMDIIDTKGGFSRRLYLTDEVVGMLVECDSKNEELIPGRTPFFISKLGNRIDGTGPGAVFKRLWSNAGLAYPVEGTLPRPYALRHRFAFANIERWVAEGVDVMAMMPYLMRCMGHTKIDSTCYYLHVSPDYMARLAEVDGRSALLLPEVGFDA